MKSFYWIIFASILLTFNLFSAIPQIERQALTALYNSTNGDNWTDNSGWKTPPLHTDGFAMPGTEGTWKGITVTNNSVTMISLYSNNLTGSIPPKIGNLVKLYRLYLYSNLVSGPIPPEISNLVNLQYLYIDKNKLSGSIPPEISNMTNLQYLDLSDNQLSGSIPPEIGNMINLLDLDLSYNLLSGSIPPEIGNMTNLQILNSNDNQLSGSIPSQIANMTKLLSLILYDNNFSGSIPPEIGSMTNLQSLNLSDNQLSGSVPPEIGSMTNLQSFNLSANQLSGSIPPEIGSMTNLQSFNLSANQLSGSIPPEIGNLAQLKYLYLYNNQVNGSIPPEIGNLVNLQNLYLYNNQLNGYYPESLVNLVKIATPNGFQCKGNYLELADNASQQLVDWLNTHSQYWQSISALEREALIALYNSTNGDNWNNKSGWKTPPLHTDGFAMPGTEHMWEGVTIANGTVTKLSFYSNKLSGSIPGEIGNLTNLKQLYLSKNQLGGPIPQEIWNLTNLSSLDLSYNQFSGSIPPEIGNLTNLSSLDLSYNQLNGSIPAEIGNLINLYKLYLHNNQLSGFFPESLINLTKILKPNNFQCHRNYLELATNASQALIDWLNAHSHQWKPLLIKEREALIALYNATNGDNWNNKTGWKTAPLHTDGFALPGTEVSWYGVTVTNGSVTKLSLNLNKMSGYIPPEIGDLTNVTVLSIQDNQLSGTIPSSIGNLVNLTGLYMNNNKLTGSIPAEIGNLILLTYVNFQTNQLSGVIPTSIGNLVNLTTLYLYNNKLNGSIPAEIGNLIKLIRLDLSYNQLSGSIPVEIGNLSNCLEYLYLQYNQLSGALPSAIGNLVNLKYLYINNNQLSGYFPESLVNLTKIYSDNGFCFAVNNLRLAPDASQALIDWIDDHSGDPFPIPLIEREALIALYNSTNGDNWTDNSGWKSPPLHTDGFAMPGTEQDWYGIKRWDSVNHIEWIDLGLVDSEPLIFGNNLVGMIPPEIGNLTSLTFLDLAYNHISGSVPPEIGNLTNLQLLDLSHNQFTGPIFDEVIKMKSLYWLRLSYNMFTGLFPQQIGTLKNLEVFQIHYNQFTGYFPESLVNLTNISYYYHFCCGGNFLQLQTNASQALVDWLNNNSLDWKPIPQIEREALIALYNATNGDNWFNNQDWKTPPLHTDGFAMPGTEYYWSYIYYDFGIQVENGHVTNVLLEDNNLSGFLPPEIGDLTYLQWFNIYKNPIGGYFPETLTKLTSPDFVFSDIDTKIQIAVGSSAELRHWINQYSSNYLYRDRMGLIALYNATNGDNWTKNTGWKTPPLHTDGFAMPGTEKNWYGVNIYTQRVGALDLSNNNLSGSIPAGIVNMSSLSYLKMSQNHLSGFIPIEILKTLFLERIDLSNNSFSGPIPPEICDLTYLKDLNLSYNQLSGPIPPEIGNLSEFMWKLQLSNNQLSGPIPPEIGNLTNLSILDLSYNQLSGYFPESLANLVNIYSGPYEWGFRFAGNYLNLAPNASQNLINWINYHSTDPLPIPQIEREALIALYQATDGDNWADNSGWKTPPLHTDGFAMPGTEVNWYGIGVSMGHVRAIWLNNYQEFLSLIRQRNTTNQKEINQKIIDLWRQGKNSIAKRGNQLHGQIPPEIGNLSQLEYLELRNNQLSGPIPPEIGNLINLHILDLSYNQLSGSIPIEIGNITNFGILDLSNNKLSGSIPAEIGNLSSIFYFELYLANNQLSGPIPPEIGNLIYLWILDLSYNQLSGYFPESLVNLINMSWGGFHFAGNYLNLAPDASEALIIWLATHSADPLPIPQLEREALIAIYQATDGDNWTNNSGWKTPPLHTEGFAMPGTENNWYGIDAYEGHVRAIWLNNYQEFSSLIRQRNTTNQNEINQKIIDLWRQGKNSSAKRSNQLRGQIPPEIGNLSQLGYLELSNNQLSGPIPPEIGNLINLRILDLSNNQLSGYFSESLANLVNIYSGPYEWGFRFAGNYLQIAPDASQALIDWLVAHSQDTLPIAANERAALIDLYQATNGDNWFDNWGWKEPPLHIDGFAMPGTESNWRGIQTRVCWVHGIYLSNNNLTGNLPASFSQLNKLHYLNLAHNQLSGIFPVEILHLLCLKELNLSYNLFSGSLPEAIGNLLNLNILDISFNQFSGYFPESLANLSNMFIEGFRYAGNALQLAPDASQALQNWVAAYSSERTRTALIALYNATDGDNWTNRNGWKTPPLHSDGFALPGTEHTWYGITASNGSIIQINLSNNHLIGSIPAEIGNLGNLQQLYLNTNQLSGTIPPSIGNLSKLTQLRLQANQLTGSIPVEIGNLTELIYLQLNENQLSGTIPVEIGNLAKLILLHLNSNQLSGTIPAAIGNLTQLSQLWLSSNQFSGAIPTEIGNLINLTQLYLQLNQFSGYFPENLTKLSNINTPNGFKCFGNSLALAGNASSTLIAWLNSHSEDWKMIAAAERHALIALYNAANGDQWTNHSGWKTPPLHSDGFALPGSEGEWQGITVYNGQVTNITLNNNQLSGTIPGEIGNLVNLTYLDLSSNQLTGSIPQEISLLTKLTKIYLNNNQLSGSIPSEIGNLINLTSLELQNNLLSGYFPESLVNLIKIGKPSGFKCSVNDLTLAPDASQALIDWLNSHSVDWKPIPASERQALIALYLSTNGNSWYYRNGWKDTPLHTDGFALPGTEGYWYGITLSNGHVTKVLLTNNKLSGTIPQEIGNLTCLAGLSLNSNGSLSGEIPPQIGNLTQLTALQLNSCKLSGVIPPGIGNLSNLTKLNLNSNQLSGAIPAEIGNLVNLTNLTLNYNQLSGAIPKEIGNLTKLPALDLSSNQLSGSIPAEIGNLVNLTGLNLKSNQLSGTIPKEIGNLTKLITLDLSFNQFTGIIPLEIGNLINLQHLYLNDNQLSGFIPAFIGNLTKLYRLYLQNNQFTGYFPENLTKLKNITNGYFKCGQNMLKLADNASQALKDWLNTESTDWMNQNSCPYDHLVGSFANMGIWLRDSENGAWTQWSKQQADIIRLADMDGNGVDDMLALFRSTDKLWLRYDDGVWQEIKASAATLTAFALADMNADGKADIIGSWSDLGLWWLDTAGGDWSKLSNLVPSLLTAADLDGDGKADVVGLFPTLNSIWIYFSNQTWKQVSKQVNLIDLRAADLDGDGIAELVGSWDIGVWQFAPQTNQWTRHHASQASQIALGDIDAASIKDIVGYWSTSTPLFVKYLELNTWKKLSNYQPLTMDSGRVK